MKRLLAGLALAFALPAFAAEIPITFRPSPSQPAPDIPLDARGAGTVPDPNAARGGSAGVAIRLVPDSRDHGPFSAVATPGIAALEVTWWDPALFVTEAKAADFLRRLAKEPKGSTVTFVPWAQALGVPAVVANVDHAPGSRGTLHVWYGWPSVYGAYRDGSGTWWFSDWIDVETLRVSE